MVSLAIYVRNTDVKQEILDRCRTLNKAKKARGSFTDDDN